MCAGEKYTSEAKIVTLLCEMRDSFTGVFYEHAGLFTAVINTLTERSNPIMLANGQVK